MRTPFDSSGKPAARAARELGIPLTIRSVGEDYVELLRNPHFGYGKGANPCLDCHIYMTRMARQLMEERNAWVVVSGEVLGQRPMSQKRQDLDLVCRRSGLEGRLLRPLSARWLEPTIPEQEGLINRERLYSFTGRKRNGLIALAAELGISHIPAPSPGCALTETTFAPRLRDLLQTNPKATLWDCGLLRIGRHYRVSPLHKVVLGRNAEENDRIRSLWTRETVVQNALIEPESFVGPHAILCGPATEEVIRLTGSLMVSYTRQVPPNRQEVLVRVHHGQMRQVIQIDASDAAQVRQMCHLIR
ncbi:MAG: hypothetical protein JW888_13480 [Pirellulales bacterium]|nr:hypothetical protein [Pirellulales bacterium]